MFCLKDGKSVGFMWSQGGDQFELEEAHGAVPLPDADDFHGSFIIPSSMDVVDEIT